MNIAVIGAKGFVGSAIIEAISQTEYKCISISRGDNLEEGISSADIVIHAANPGKRFWAEQNPLEDFKESVQKTFEINELCKNKKLILISSISARTQLHTAYGRNRRACELLLSPDSLVVRLGPMYGGLKNAGALFDILNNRKVYISSNSRYSYAPISFCAKQIISSINKMGIIEIGAKNTISLEEVKNKLNSLSEFEGLEDTQEAQNVDQDSPDAFEVIQYALNIKQNKSTNE